MESALAGKLSSAKEGVTVRACSAVALIFVCLLTVAVASATATYRRSGATVWYREFNKEGVGLAIELALLALVAVAGVAILVIMRDSFRTLFLEGGLRSGWFLALAGVVMLGVSIYLARAPASLAEKHNVESQHVHSQRSV